jgi:hypothetical protein
MPRGKAKQDTETLEMALIGFEQKKVEIDEKIRHIKSLLSGSSVPSPKIPVRKRRPLSAAARKRIAQAQKKRWAAHRKNQSAAT